MLTPDQRFRLPEQVAAKVFDDEAILINMATGMYYSMTAVGAVIWDRLEAGRSLRETAEAVAARYDVPPAAAAADLRRLVAELVDEGLLAPHGDGAPPGTSAETDAEARQPYATPRLEVYRDMRDLLALDPPAPELTNIGWDEAADAPSRPRRGTPGR